jgi:DnaJ family protein B protein 8
MNDGHAVPDDRRRAHAVLGVEPGASAAQLRQRYLTLVRRWHPDRFATDPRSEAEAEARMRDINHAYQVLTDQEPAAPSAATAPPPHARPSPRPGERLSREQIDRMVRAIGTDGPLDGLMSTLGKLDNALWFLWILAGLMAAVRLVFDLAR